MDNSDNDLSDDSVDMVNFDEGACQERINEDISE